VTLYGDVFEALERAGVRHVVVGGIAVVLQGHVRSTVDLDLVVDLAVEPAAAAMAALVGVGLVPRLPVEATDFADPEIRRGWVETKNLQVFSFHDPCNPLREVDVFATHPLPFDELLERSVLKHVDGVAVRVASVDDLIVMKSKAGRPQDLEDIEALRRLHP
jgi:hypothetical protein